MSLMWHLVIAVRPELDAVPAALNEGELAIAANLEHSKIQNVHETAVAALQPVAAAHGLDPFAVLGLGILKLNHRGTSLARSVKRRHHQ